jgi:glyoxylase-like metal-dependent hydrolase (beta-lactamase superfamily II)
MPTEIKFIRMMSSGLFTGRLSVGYYELSPKTCVLIDSGLEDNGAKEVEKVLKARGITPVAIINTHFHADHCGGNDYFQRKYPQIRVYATTLEKPFIEHPELEPLSF